ncbi:hypothetical protein WJX72_000242 [[Myrmecia] bisecta]|uniref:PROP1-like PPR domain-containing protein n=1 Tax=[Myrmecia] bisecta TaxID=41462 RepID=A0AAW1QPX5_9CHLO
MQPSSIKTSIGRFSQQLKSFSQQTADGVGELKRHINSKPSAGPGQFRECLQDLLIEPASEIEEEVAALEGVTLDAVSLEELVGHCLAVYEENKRHIKDMEAHLAQYGYTSGFVADEAIADPRERLAQGPVAMPSAEPSGESALPTDEDADQENDPACAAQRTALKGQKPQACTAIKAQPLGQLTNLPYERQPSQSPAMSIEFPDVADALQDKYREQSLSRQPTVTPSPNVSSSSASAISFSPSLRELQRKYGKAQSRDSLDSVNAPLASDPSQGPSPAVGPALAGAVAEPASGGRQAAADGRTRIGQLAMDMANLRTSSIAASPLGRLNLRVPETPSSPQTIIPPTPLRDILEVLEQQNVAGQECESEPSENSQPGTPSGEALANAGVWDAAGNPLNPKGSASKKGRKREALAGRSHSGEAPWDMLSLKAAIVAAKVGTGQVQQAILSTTFHPQAAAFTSLFHMCAKQKLWQKALEIFEAMKARPHHVRPNTVHFSSLISACGTAGRWQEALQVFQEMKAAAMQDGGALPNVITYSALMTACCAGGRPDMAYEVFCEMKAAGIRPDAISFSTLIAGFERHGDMARAVQIHAEMCRSGLDQGMPPGGKLPIYLEQFGRKLGLLTNQGALAQQQSPWLGPASPHSHVILEGGIGEPAGPEEFQCHVSDAGGYGGEDSTLDLRANMIRENMGRSPAPGPYHSAYGPSPMAHAGLHTPTPRSYAAKPGTPSTAELLKAAHSGSSDLCPQAQQLDQEEYKKLPLRFSRQLALDQINQAVGYINTAIAAKHAEHGAPPGDAGHGITAAELESLHLGHLKTSALLNCLMSVNRLRGVTTQGNFAYHIVRQPACLPV